MPTLPFIVLFLLAPALQLLLGLLEVEERLLHLANEADGSV